MIQLHIYGIDNNRRRLAKRRLSDSATDVDYCPSSAYFRYCPRYFDSCLVSNMKIKFLKCVF